MTGWLIDTLLYTGVLIAAVLVLRRPAGRFFGPQLAYGLWALPFLRLLLPPIVLPASLAPEVAPLPVTAPVEAAPVMLDMPVVPMDLGEVSMAATPPPPVWEWSDLIAPALSIWAGVALAFLAWRFITYRAMRRELLEGARPVGEIGKVRLVETPALAAPVAFGVLDKVIALPPLFMAQPDIAARDLAIQHELAHHKGHDLLANMAAQALLALHWFNPLAWMGWRAMRRDQEAACDARVLAGRSREEVLRYASLIAGIATGPRPIAFKGALAAPMACPVLGDRSIVHRLRSLSMSEKSRRRRWFGRTLMGASALALPLTASISYAAASAQELEPVAPVAPVAEPAPAPEAAPAPDVDPHNQQMFVIHRVGPDGRHTVREFSMGPMPPMPALPEGGGAIVLPRFQLRGDPDSPEFQAEMHRFQEQMERFGEEYGEKYGKQWEDWAEQYADRWENWAEQHAEGMAEHHREQAEGQAERQRERAEARAQRQSQIAIARAQGRQAWAVAPNAAPVMIHNCDEADENSETTSDGRNRVVICARDVRQLAGNNLRFAREQIANNNEMSAEVRDKVLHDLDEEIVRIEREEAN